MFSFLKRLFKGTPRPPKHIAKGEYLLKETLKPLVRGKVLNLGKQLIDGASLEGKGKFDQVIAIDSGENISALFDLLVPGGELLYIENSFRQPRWKGKSLKRKYPNATIHPIAIHWWLIHFKHVVS